MERDKVFYTTSLLDDDGILWIRSGWYMKEFPFVGTYMEEKIDMKLGADLIEKETCKV